MKKLILLICLSASLALADDGDPSCTNDKGTIDTNVNYQAGTSFLHTIQHHWKFEFWRGAVCWGSADDQWQGNEKKNDSSTACNGSMAYNTAQSQFRNYTPVKVSWGANLTEDDVFKVSFTQDITKVQYVSDDGTCTTDRQQANLDTYSVNYHVKGSIPIPNDVWILMIRAKKDPSTNVKIIPYVGRESQQKGNADHSLQSVPNEWAYLFVTPGEKINLVLDYKNGDNSSGQRIFKVDYELSFIGHNRCEAVLKNPATFNYQPGTIQDLVLQNPTTEEQKHQFALRLGCMRNPAFLRGAMANSRGENILPMLNDVRKGTENIIRESKEKSSDTFNKNLNFVFSILQMTELDLARFALEDQLAYCQIQKNYHIQSAKIDTAVDLPNLEFMSILNAQMHLYVDEIPWGPIGTYIDLLKKFEGDSNTYKAVMKLQSENIAALRAFETRLLSAGNRQFEFIARKIQQIPSSVIDSNERQDFVNRLAKYNKNALYLDAAIRQSLLLLGQHSNTVLSTQDMQTYHTQLLKDIESTKASIDGIMAWYLSDKNSNSKFVSDMKSIADDYLKATADFFTQNNDEELKGHFDDFVKKDQIEKLYAQVNKCLMTPTSGGSK